MERPLNEPSRLSLHLLLVCLATHLYLLGAATLLFSVAYPMMDALGASSLVALHDALQKRLGLPFVAAELFSFLSALALLAKRPRAVPAWAAWACVGLGLLYFSITFGVHLPAHGRVSFGNEDAMHPLLVSHAARTALVALQCGMLLWMTKNAIVTDAESARRGSA